MSFSEELRALAACEKRLEQAKAEAGQETPGGHRTGDGGLDLNGVVEGEKRSDSGCA